MCIVELWKRVKIRFASSGRSKRGTIGYYLSALEVEERNAVVVSAENHTVQKVVCDHRYGKYSVYALTTGIENDLKTGVVKDWFRSDLNISFKQDY